MTAPGSDARGSASPVGLRRDPAPSPGCYRVVMREPTHGWTVRPIVGAENPEHAMEKGLVLFPHSTPIRSGFIHGRDRRSHLCPEPVVGRSHIERRRRVA